MILKVFTENFKTSKSFAPSASGVMSVVVECESQDKIGGVLS